MDCCSIQLSKFYWSSCFQNDWTRPVLHIFDICWCNFTSVLNFTHKPTEEIVRLRNPFGSRKCTKEDLRHGNQASVWSCWCEYRSARFSMLMWMASHEFYQVCYFFLMVFAVISIPFVRDLFHRPSVRDMLGRWRLPMTLECTTALSALVAMVSSSG